MGLTAVDPATNVRWYRTLENTIPALTSSREPPAGRIYSFHDAPCQLSSTRQTCWRWTVSNGVFSVHSVPLDRGTLNYIEYVAPDGSSYALELDDSGVESLIVFPSRLRAPEYPVLVGGRGQFVFMPDTRFPLPRFTHALKR